MKRDTSEDKQIRDFALSIAFAGFLLLLLLGILMLAGCATRPKQYQPPDKTAVNAATFHVKQDSQKSHEIAGAGKKLIASAQEKADSVVVISHNIDVETEAVLKAAPDELKPQLMELTKNIDALQVKEVELQTDLRDAWGRANDLEQNLIISDRHITDLEKQQGEYFLNAQKLADDATNERNARIKAEKAESWYRWHFWGSWIVLGAGIIACIVFAVLKWGAKWSAKVAVVAGRVGI